VRVSAEVSEKLREIEGGYGKEHGKLVKAKGKLVTIYGEIEEVF
jgi:hypothetical protein